MKRTASRKITGGTMHLAEPSTTLTDYLLSAVAATLGLRLDREGRRLDQGSVRLWGGALLSAALAALVGGSSHGLGPMMDAATREVLMKATVLAIAVASFLALTATLLASSTGAWRRLLFAAAVVKLIVVALLFMARAEFRIALYDSAVSMAVVVALETWQAAREGGRRLRWFLTGLAVSFGGATLQQARVGAPPINHNDLYHVVQALGLWLLYRGALLVRDRF